MSDQDGARLAEGVRPMDSNEFVDQTGTIHTWCHFGTVSVPKLLAQLKQWVAYFEEPSDGIKEGGQ